MTAVLPALAALARWDRRLPLCQSLRGGMPRALELVEDLDRLASAHGMRDLQAEARGTTTARTAAG